MSDISQMSEISEIEKPIKTKKREITPKQKEAFEKMVEKKKEIDRIKTEHTNAVKAQKQAY